MDCPYWPGCNMGGPCQKCDGEFPFVKNESGDWINIKTGRKARVLNLHQFLGSELYNINPDEDINQEFKKFKEKLYDND